MGYSFDEDYSAAGNSNGTYDKCGVCIHHAAGCSIDMTPSFLNNGTSATYGVEPGHVRQFLDENAQAWAAGDEWANNYLIHIENVNSAGDSEGWPVAEETIDTLIELLADIANRQGWGEYVVGENLYGHKDFYATFCPGVLYDRLQEIAERTNARLRGESEDDVSAEDVWNFDQNGVLMRDRIQGTDQAANSANEAAGAARDQLTRTDDVSGRGTEANLYERMCWMGARTAEISDKLDELINLLKEKN